METTILSELSWYADEIEDNLNTEVATSVTTINDYTTDEISNYNTTGIKDELLAALSTYDSSIVTKLTTEMNNL